MDLRSLPPDLDAAGRVAERRKRVETETGLDLTLLRPVPETLGAADEKNCEQMIGAVPLPVGYAGPLDVTFSSQERASLHLPLATTEGALVASVNRGCKAVSLAGGARTSSVHRGITRSLAFLAPDGDRDFARWLEETRADWTSVAEGTSDHLTVLSHDIEQAGRHVFLTIACDTDEAMGMNMVTIAAQAAGGWILEHAPQGVRFVTVAGNVDSDKKPSLRTKQRGRGYEVSAEVMVKAEVLRDVLKSSAHAMEETWHAKVVVGSQVAGSLGENLHAANVIAALYLSTGQDAAHVVEGSLADTTAKAHGNDLLLQVRLPAVLVGLRGGGTALPAQSRCLDLLLQPKTSLHRKAQLAESVGAAVLAGELSLLAAQTTHTLASAHGKLAR